MKQVEALQTVHGSYGLKKQGEKFALTPKVAAELEEKGIVKIIGDAEEKAEAFDKAEPEPETEKVNSLGITDNTGKEKKSITKPVTKKGK